MVDILLSVYNGEKYLRRQLDSILAQDCGEWRILIRDDGSVDSSAELIAEYSSKYPDKIMTVPCGEPSGSAKRAFLRLMEYSDAEYTMFCDQDDIWLPDKVRRTLGAMKRMERECGADMPLLVHTELIVADMKSGKCSESFTEYQGLDPMAKSLPRLLCQNNVTGCTMMINRALVRFCLSESLEAVYDDILMHDWWLALLAAACGKIGFVRRPTMLYRQHGANTLGAVKTKSPAYVLSMLFKRGESAKRVKRTFLQADALLSVYGDRLPRESRRILTSYLAIEDMSKARKICALIKGDFLKQNTLHIIGQLVFA